MNYVTSKPEHEAAYQDVCALLAKHKDKLTAIEMLAIAANLVGKLVAMQDRQTVTTDDAMLVVSRNIEHGNQQAIAAMTDTAGMARN